MTTRSERRPRFRAAGMTLAIAGVVLGCAAPIAPVVDRADGPQTPTPTTLTLITTEDEPSGVQPFVDSDKRLTDGSLTIDVRTEWRPGEATAESGIIHDVIDGKADLGVAGARAFDVESIGVTAFQGFLAPFLISSYQVEERVLSGA